MQLGGGQRKWEDNIKADIGEIGYEDGRQTELAQDRVVLLTFTMVIM